MTSLGFSSVKMLILRNLTIRLSPLYFFSLLYVLLALVVLLLLPVPLLALLLMVPHCCASSEEPSAGAVSYCDVTPATTGAAVADAAGALVCCPYLCSRCSHLGAALMMVLLVLLSTTTASTATTTTSANTTAAVATAVLCCPGATIPSAPWCCFDGVALGSWHYYNHCCCFCSLVCCFYDGVVVAASLVLCLHMQFVYMDFFMFLVSKGNEVNKYALRVIPAETRLMVYRRLRVLGL